MQVSMQCYHISKGKVVKGIPFGRLPSVGFETSKTIEKADVELIGKDVLSVPFEDLQHLSMQRLSAVCKTHLVKTSKENENMAIMAYAPFEVFPDREMGDESDIVYRSNALFAAIIYKNKTWLRVADSDNTVTFSRKGVLLIGDSNLEYAPLTDSFVIRIT